MPPDEDEARAPRVAMLVLNTCDSDARVLREAATLRSAGYDVRIFAFSNRAFPPAVVSLGGTTVERLPVAAAYTTALRRLSGVRTREPATSAGSAPSSAGWAAPAAGSAGSPAVKMISSPQRAPSPSARTAGWARLRHFLVGRAYAAHRPYTVASYWRAAISRVTAWAPDVVHAHDLNTLPAAVRIAHRVGAAVVYDSHELWRRRNRHGERRPLARAVEAVLERRCIRRVDAILTVSPGIAAWLTARYAPAAPIRVLRNVPTCSDAAPAAASLADLAGTAGRRILLYTGRAMPGRGLELAVEALPALPDDVDLVLLGYGDRRYAARLAARARATGVADRVHTVPAVPPEQVATVARGADAALVAIEPVCESYRYALPNKLFEAVQAALPVVASELPDIADVVRRYGVGELFPVGDRSAFVAAATEVLADPAPYRDAAIRAAGELCWEREQAVLLATYRGLPVSRAPHAG